MMGLKTSRTQALVGDVTSIRKASSNILTIRAVSEATYRLIQGYFACQDLGTQTLRGVTESMHIYQVLRESGATSRLDIAQPRGLTPLVERESEVTLLFERWEQA